MCENLLIQTFSPEFEKVFNFVSSRGKTKISSYCKFKILVLLASVKKST
jgi:hypothetical protein